MARLDTLVLVANTLGASDTAGVSYVALPSVLNDGSTDAKWLLVGLTLCPNITQSASDTNYRTYEVYGVDGSTAQSSRATNVAGGALTAGTKYVQTLTGGANAVFLPGSVVKCSAGLGGGTEPAENTNWILTFELLR